MTTPNDAPRPTSEVRHATDPVSGKTVEIRNDLKRRLLGYYASGPTMENGEPEFGWRKFGEPKPIEIEAAASLQALEARNKLLEQASCNAHKVFAAEIEQLHVMIKSLEARNVELEGALATNIPNATMPTNGLIRDMEEWDSWGGPFNSHERAILCMKHAAAKLKAVRAALRPTTKTEER